MPYSALYPPSTKLTCLSTLLRRTPHTSGHTIDGVGPSKSGYGKKEQRVTNEAAIQAIAVALTPKNRCLCFVHVAEEATASDMLAFTPAMQTKSIHLTILMQPILLAGSNEYVS